MQKTKYTPGPWINDNRYVRRADGELIASFRTKQIPPIQEGANADLCAAAIDLLDALKDAYEKLKIECSGVREYKGGVPTQILFNKIEAAIEKAEGK